MKRGIDVSSYQGKIDWSKVKPYIDFAIIRCGWGNDFQRQDDVYFERNAKYCKELNIPFGVYLFSYATNIDEARSEVRHTLRLIKDKKLEYPVFLDVETKQQMALPKEELVDIVKYYCKEIEDAGYYVGIYSSLNRFRDNLNSKELDAYDKWVAEWNDKLTYHKNAGMWQNTSYEEIPGIKSRVDSDIALIDYPRIIRNANLNHLNENHKYSKGEKVFVSGDIYNDENASEIINKVCDKEYTIEKIFDNALAPYKINDGYIKEENIYKKVY